MFIHDGILFLIFCCVKVLKDIHKREVEVYGRIKKKNEVNKMEKWRERS